MSTLIQSPWGFMAAVLATELVAIAVFLSTSRTERALTAWGVLGLSVFLASVILLAIRGGR